MDLSKIVPQASTFTLRQAPGETFTMRPINLEDEIWLDKTFGDQIGPIFENVNIKEISRIIFRLLTPESKAFFKKREVSIINEEGDESSVQLGGLDLLRSLISGWEEKVLILDALLKNIGLSRPDIDEDDTKESEEDKKKLKK